MTAFDDQHRQMPVEDLHAFANSTVHRCPTGNAGLMPCCGRTPFELPRGDRLSEDPQAVTCTVLEEERRKITTVGYRETAAEVAKLVGSTGAHRFALVWTHPEFPVHDDAEPPAGTAVTWTAVACYQGGPKRVARELGIDRQLVRLVDGRPVVAASCYSDDPGKAVSCACAELMRLLGANVTLAGGSALPVVETPPEALLEALA